MQIAPPAPGWGLVSCRCTYLTVPYALASRSIWPKVRLTMGSGAGECGKLGAHTALYCGLMGALADLCTAWPAASLSVEILCFGLFEMSKFFTQVILTSKQTGAMSGNTSLKSSWDTEAVVSVVSVSGWVRVQQKVSSGKSRPALLGSVLQPNLGWGLLRYVLAALLGAGGARTCFSCIPWGCPDHSDPWCTASLHASRHPLWATKPRAVVGLCLSTQPCVCSSRSSWCVVAPAQLIEAKATPTVLVLSNWVEP